MKVFKVLILILLSTISIDTFAQSTITIPTPAQAQVIKANLEKINVYFNENFDVGENSFLTNILGVYFTFHFAGFLSDEYKDITVEINAGATSKTTILAKEKKDNCKRSVCIEVSPNAFDLYYSKSETSFGKVETLITSPDLYMNLDEIFLKYFSKEKLVESLGELFNTDKLVISKKMGPASVLHLLHLINIIPPFVREHVVIKEIDMYKHPQDKSVEFSEEGGRYVEHKIAFDEKYFYENGLDDHVLLHEYGHAVYFQYLDADQMAQWNDLSKTSLAFVSIYAGTNSEEDFAETFAFYILGAQELKEKAPDKYDFIKNNVMCKRSGNSFIYNEYKKEKIEGAKVKVPVIIYNEAPVVDTANLVNIKENGASFNISINKDNVHDASGYSGFNAYDSKGQLVVTSEGDGRYTSIDKINTAGSNSIDISKFIIYDKAGNSTTVYKNYNFNTEGYKVVEDGFKYDSNNINKGSLIGMDVLKNINIEWKDVEEKDIKQVGDVRTITISNLPPGSVFGKSIFMFTWGCPNGEKDAIRFYLEDLLVPKDGILTVPIHRYDEFFNFDSKGKCQLSHVYWKDVYNSDYNEIPYTDLLNTATYKDSIVKNSELSFNSIPKPEPKGTTYYYAVNTTVNIIERTDAGILVKYKFNVKNSSGNLQNDALKGFNGYGEKEMSFYNPLAKGWKQDNNIVNIDKFEIEDNALVATVFFPSNCEKGKYSLLEIVCGYRDDVKILFNDYVTPIEYGSTVANTDDILNESSVDGVYDEKNNKVVFSMDFDYNKLVSVPRNKITINLGSYDGSVSTCDIYVNKNDQGELKLDFRHWQDSTQSDYSITDSGNGNKVLHVNIRINAPSKTDSYYKEAVYKINDISTTQYGTSSYDKKDTLTNDVLFYKKHFLKRTYIITTKVDEKKLELTPLDKD